MAPGCCKIEWHKIHCGRIGIGHGTSQHHPKQAAVCLEFGLPLRVGAHVDNIFVHTWS